MPLVVDEIFVGENNRSMGVLASSLSKDDSQVLAHHLDLPGQPPQSFSLDTYVSGFTVKNYYVISRTSKDPQANRAGMVFSHAFVFDKNDIEQLNDIRAIFRQLSFERPLEFTPSQKMINSNEAMVQEFPPPGIVCDMLTARSNSTIVITDSHQYEDLVARIWFRLLPSMRSGFHFKLSFAPEEANRENLNFALVPDTVLRRWSLERRINSDTYNDTSPATSLAGQSIAASDNGEISKFVKQLELERIEFPTLGLIGQACELSNTGNFKSSLTALRLIAKLQPDPSKGLIIKIPLTRIVFDSSSSNKPEDILALRNFDWTPFSLTNTTPTNLQDKFDACFQVAEAKREKQQIIESILESNKATSEWQQAGKEALANLTHQAAKGLVVTAWNILLRGSTTEQHLFEIVPSEVLDELMSSFDTVVPFSVTQIETRKFLAKNKYFQSEAMLLKKSHGNDNMSALAEACRRDRDLFSDFAIINILDASSGKNKIQASIDIGDDLVIDDASLCVAENPSLLSSFKLHDKHIQTIWSNALSRSPDAWKIDKELAKVQDKVLDIMKEGGIASSVLTALMKTPAGNWIAYKDRSSIWNYLSGESLNAALDKTARGWIALLPDIVRDTNSSLEPVLAKVIAKPAYHESMLTALKNCTFNDILTTFLNNSHLSDTLFFDSLMSSFNLGNKPSSAEVESMGRLASARKWVSLTRKLFSRSGADGFLRPYFKICADHLFMWDRIYNDLSYPSKSDITDLLLDTLTELYPTGLEDSDIWERAGGDLAKIDLSGNGRDQWQRALRHIRLGSSLSYRNLFNQMLDEYPNNSKLQYLKEKV